MGARRESRMRAFAAKLRGFLNRQPPGDGFDDEIHEHVRLLADRFVAQGMSREDAALAARRQFGNTTLLQEDRKALQTCPSIEAWWYDLRYARRVLWKQRGFAAVSIVTLAGAVLGLLAGHWCQRIGHARALGIGLPIMAAAAGLCAMADSASLLLLARGLAGWGYLLVAIASPSLPSAAP